MQLTPEIYEQLMTMGSDNEGLESKLKQQIAQAQAMRTPNPGMVDTGRFKMAPTGIEKLTAGMRNMKADQMMTGPGGAQATDDKMRDNRLQQQLAVMKAILAGQYKPPEQGQYGGSGGITPGSGANYGSISPTKMPL